MTYTFDDIVSLRNAVLRHLTARFGVAPNCVEAEVQTYLIAGLEVRDVLKRLHEASDQMEASRASMLQHAGLRGAAGGRGSFE